MFRTALSVVAALALSGAVSEAQTPPVVTIDSYNRFCINGTPTFLIGTMNGDADDWQNFLKPAGFNFRFLGSTAAPGAHSVGLWEVPDVYADPSAISTMRLDPYYLMWDLGWEIDYWLPHYTQWVGKDVDSIRLKRLDCTGYDGSPPRPVAACWGNAKRVQGSEHWGWQGYWTGYRQYFPHTDYMVVGDYSWGLEEQTVAHAVRMSTKPVIYMTRCYATPDPPEGTQPEPQVVARDIWLAAISGAKGVIIDSFAGQDAYGDWYSWPYYTPSHWSAINKTCLELRQIESALLATGPWVYYKTGTDYWVMYTYRKVGSDLYLMAVNRQIGYSHAVTIMVPIAESSAPGEVLFDFLASGAISYVTSSTTIQDLTKSWTTNQLVGHKLRIRHGAPQHEHTYTIASNASNTITIASGNLTTDGAARGDAYEVAQIVTLSNRTLSLTLDPAGRKVIKFPNVTFSYQASKTPAAVGSASSRKWVVLMDYSSQVGTQCCPADAFGLAYDSYRHRLVAVMGLGNYWPQGKPDPVYRDAEQVRFVWEWDIDSGYYSGPIQDGDQQAGDPWPAEPTSYQDMVYDPVRRCTVQFNKETREVEEWRGVELGWRRVPAVSPPNNSPPWHLSHYAAAYVPTLGRTLVYGGKEWYYPGDYHRSGQFDHEWINMTYTYDGTYWYLCGNEANLTITGLQEPVMAYDSSRGQTVLFGLSHDGRYNADIDPRRYFQDTPQQTYEYNNINCVRKYPAHVPYVYYNYQMVFDPRSNTTLLFGGWPSVNGRGTDLYEYNGTDWKRLDYNYASLPAQDARRIPTLTYDPDHQMVLFVDTRGHKIWGLTSGQETNVGTIDAARALPDGALLSIEGKVVGRRFDGYFYMQEPDRTSGIRVVSSSTAAEPGTTVNVIGAVGTLPTGEKQIVARVVGVSGQAKAEPLGIGSRHLGGTAEPNAPGVYGGIGPNNLGLVVRACGKLTHVGTGFVYIDDGSGLTDGSGQVGVKVVLNGVNPPGVNQFVAVTGVSGVESIAGSNARVILLAREEDLRVW